MMLHDEHLVGAAVEYIRDEKINAEWALRRAVDDIRSVFDQIEDAYLRERRSDVEFVFERVLRNLLGRDIGPAVAAARRDRRRVRPVAGGHRDAAQGRGRGPAHRRRRQDLATPRSSRARTRSPRSSALENITELVETDDLLLLDGGTRHGDRQSVARAPSRSTASEQRRQVAEGVRFHAMRDLPARTRDDVDVVLLANIDGPDELDDALEYGAMGVGLFRTEYLFMTGDRAARRGAPLPDGGRGARASSRASRRRSARSTSAATSWRASSSRPTSTSRTRRSGCARSGCACRRSAAICSARSCAACCARRRTGR